MGFGCKYWKFNFEKMREDCTLTNCEVLESGTLCDYDYEQCPNYKTRLEPVKKAITGQISFADLGLKV